MIALWIYMRYGVTWAFQPLKRKAITPIYRKAKSWRMQAWSYILLFARWFRTQMVHWLHGHFLHIHIWWQKTAKSYRPIILKFHLAMTNCWIWFRRFGIVDFWRKMAMWCLIQFPAAAKIYFAHLFVSIFVSRKCAVKHLHLAIQNFFELQNAS